MKHLKKLFNELDIRLKKITQFFLYSGIVLSFFQINIAVFQDVNWSGQFNPYTTFQIYASDVAFLMALLSYGLYAMIHSKSMHFTCGNNFTKSSIGIMFTVIFASYFSSVDKTISLFWIISMIKVVVVYLMIINRLAPMDKIIRVVLYSMAFQVVIAVFQFIFQSSLSLSMLGESKLAPDMLGVAKINIGNLQILRPYGTQLHPNILGGILSIGAIFSSYIMSTRSAHSRALTMITSLLILGVLISFSRSAWLATTISLAMYTALRRYKVKYIHIERTIFIVSGTLILSYVTGIYHAILIRLNIFNDTSFIERLEQIRTSLSIMKAHPFGVGIGNYTNQAHIFSDTALYPWEIQPVHSTFLLIGSELGIIGLLISVGIISATMIILFKKVQGLTGKYKCFPLYLSIVLIMHVFILSNFDHYFYTTNTAKIVLAVMFGVITIQLQQIEESRVVVD